MPVDRGRLSNGNKMASNAANETASPIPSPRRALKLCRMRLALLRSAVLDEVTDFAEPMAVRSADAPLAVELRGDGPRLMVRR